MATTLRWMIPFSGREVVQGEGTRLRKRLGDSRQHHTGCGGRRQGCLRVAGPDRLPGPCSGD